MTFRFFSMTLKNPMEVDYVDLMDLENPVKPGLESAVHSGRPGFASYRVRLSPGNYSPGRTSGVAGPWSSARDTRARSGTSSSKRTEA